MASLGFPTGLRLVLAFETGEEVRVPRPPLIVGHPLNKCPLPNCSDKRKSCGGLRGDWRVLSGGFP
jgi:hypothetical protein